MLCGMKRLAGRIRAFSTTATLHKDGYEIIRNIFKVEEIESVKRTANSILRYLDERKETTKTEEDYLYYSGGYSIKSNFSVINISGESKLIIGSGIAVMGQRMDYDVDAFKEFAYSKAIQEVVKETFNMQAPALAGMSYIFEMQNEWSTYRKENSYYRTRPFTTKGILVSLSDMPKDEGIFIIPNSHKAPPTTLLRKQEGKIIVESEVDPKLMQGEQIILGKGETMLYDGNLSYKMY